MFIQKIKKKFVNYKDNYFESFFKGALIGLCIGYAIVVVINCSTGQSAFNRLDTISCNIQEKFCF